MRRRVLLVGLCTLGLLACNAILGLDGDTRVAGIAEMDASSTDSTAPPGPDAGNADGTTPDGSLPDGAPVESGVDNDAGPLLQLAAGALGGLGNGDGLGEIARFNRIVGAVADENGNHYVIEHGDEFERSTVIRRVDPTTNEVTTLAGSRLSLGTLDGAFAMAEFQDLRSIVYDAPNKRLYVLDSCHLRRLDLMTQMVSTLAPPPEAKVATCVHQDSPLVPSLADTANALAIDPGGTVYIAEAPFLRSFGIDGTLHTICGKPTGDTGTGDCSSHEINTNELVYSPLDFALFFRVAASNATSEIRSLSVKTGGEIATFAPLDGGIPGPLLAGRGIALGQGPGSLVLVEDRQLRYVDQPTHQNGIGAGDNLVAAGHTDGTSTLSRFEQIGSIAKGADKQYDIGDLTTLRVSTGSDVRTVAGLAHPPSFLEGARGDARFGNAWSMTSAGEKAYFYDSVNAVIASLDATGNVKLLSGIVGTEGTNDDPLGIHVTLPRNAGGIVFDGTEILLSTNGLLKPTVRGINPGSGGSRLITDTMSLGAAFTADPAKGVIYFTGPKQKTIMQWIPGDADPTSVTGLAGDFMEISGVCWDASLKVLVVSDRQTDLISTVTGIGGDVVIAPIAGTNLNAAHIDSPSNGLDAAFVRPDGVACDGNGNVWVNERATGSIRKIELAHDARVSTPVGMFDGQHGIVIGPLPGRLNMVSSILPLPDGRTLVGSRNEGAIVFFR